MIEKDGWYIAPGTQNSILKQAGLKMKYLIVIEETSTGFSAYSPDIDGCIATGGTKKETENNMKDAIEFHLEGLHEEGIKVPEPHSYSQYLEVSA